MLVLLFSESVNSNMNLEKKLRILHVSPSFARTDGGPSEGLRGMLPELRKMGMDVSLFATDKGLTADDADVSLDPRTKIFHQVALSSWSFAPSMILELTRVASSFDLVHIHSFPSFPSSIAMIAARRAGTPYVIQPHGSLDTYHWNQRRLKKVAYRQTIDGYGIRGLSGVIFSSKREVEQGQLILGGTRSFMVPQAVSSDVFAAGPRTDHESSHEILFLGRVTEKKRVDIAIRAIADSRLRDYNLNLTIAGPLDDRLAYDPVNLARELGVADRIRFTGQVDAQKRRELLRGATVFVLPSEDESFGIAVAEAMAAGCPVLTTQRVGIAPRAAEHDALLLCELSVDGFAKGLAYLLDNRKLRMEMSQQAIAYAKANFTWEIAARAANDCYQAVLRA